MCNNHMLGAFFNDRPEIPHPSIFIKYIILYQVVWNTAQLIHAAVTWILNKQSWLMNVPCITTYHTELFGNFTRQRLQFICHEFNARMKNEWTKIWMKLTSGILLVYIQDEIYFLNKQRKRKCPTPGQFYFPFLPDKGHSWWMHLNVGLNAYSFDLLCSNNFSKWIKFGYEGGMCMSLYIASYLSALSIYLLHI